MHTILLLVAAIVSVAAQAYEPLIREDRVWEYYNEGGGNICLYRYQFDGTQEINGTTYHQFKHKTTIIWETKYTVDSEGNRVYYDVVSDPIQIDETVALIREENQKVYMYVEYPNLYVYNPEQYYFEFQDLPEDKEIVILDFSENEIGSKFFATGDHQNFDNYYRFYEGWPITQYELLSVDEDNNSKAKILKLRNIAQYNDVETDPEWSEKANVRIAEGVGNIGRGYFFMPQTEIRFIPTHDYNYSYVEDYFNVLYDLDGNVLFKGIDKHPDTSGVGTVEISVDKEGKMYDLFGRELRPDAQLAPGTIYIRDGKKHIAR